MTDMNLVIEKFQEVRNAKAKLVAKHKEEIAPYDQAIARLEAYIQSEFSRLNVTSMNTPSGTAVVSQTTRLRITDWDKALDFIRQGERWVVLNKALSKNAIVEWRKYHAELRFFTHFLRSP